MKGGSEAAVTLFLVGCVAVGGIAYMSSGSVPGADMATRTSIDGGNPQQEQSLETRSEAASTEDQTKGRAPLFPNLSFEDFPAESPGKIGVGPSFTGNQAHYSGYRTLLQSAAKDAPNFGGYLIIVGHGCGTDCVQYMMINSRTGRVTDILPPDIDTDVQQHVLDFRDSSNLLLESFKSDLNEENISSCHERAYQWNGTELVLLASRRHQLPPGTYDCQPQLSPQQGRSE